MSDSNPKQTRLYLPALDGLRALAFLSVFVFHLTIPAAYAPPSPFRTLWNGLFMGGKYGVSLFFVLSAYLVTLLLLKERERTGHISVRDFYIRRCLRIWPLYYTVTAVAVVLAIARVQIPGFAPTTIWTILAAALFQYDLFIPWLGGSVIGIFWSLGIEEKYYAIWPLIVRGCDTARLRLVAFAMIGGGVLFKIGLGSLFLNDAIWYFPLTHLDAFGWGALLATGSLTKRENSSLLLLPGLLLGLTIIGMIDLGTPGNWGNITVRIAAASGVSALASALLIRSVGAVQRGWLTNDALREVGKRSYGLYVLHVVPIVLIQHLVPDTHSKEHWLAQLGGLLLTAGLAWGSYRFLESPFLRLKARFERVASRPV